MEEEFRIVERKRGQRRRHVRFVPPPLMTANIPLGRRHSNQPQVDVNKAVKRITDFRAEIQSSEFYRSCVHTVGRSLQSLSDGSSPDVESPSLLHSIVCYGLGNFTQCTIACYQLALLLCLKQELRIEKAFVFDPVFLHSEEEILESLGVNLIDCNEEGKRAVSTPTLFYLPHCGKALYNNLLWANWGAPLTRLLILGNSFSRVFDTVSRGALRDRWPYLLRAAAHAQELSVANNFRYRDVFNDLAIHVFPAQKISSFPKEYWEDCSEPVYDSNEIEIITNEMMKHFK